MDKYYPNCAIGILLWARKITPTNACPSLILEGEDYGLKVSINVHSQGGVRAMQVSGPLEHDVVMRLQGLIADEHYR